MNDRSVPTGRRARQSELIGGQAPRDPALAGFTGRGRRPVGAWLADPNGNRAERRAHARRDKARRA